MFPVDVLESSNFIIQKMIFDLIRKRRAVFPAQYNDKPVSREEIEAVLEAANWAPTHKKTEPWRFKVVTGPAKQRLGEFMARTYQDNEVKPKQMKIKKYKENPLKAAVIILICMQRDPLKRVPEWEEIAATAMAVQNMWLGCTALGIGSYWSSPSLIDKMNNFIDLNEGERCLGLFYMGNYDPPIPDGERTPISEKLEWINQ